MQKYFKNMIHYSDTRYLNGLRGWAAVLVYWHHHEIWAHRSAINIFERAYGYHERYHLVTLPWIRLLFNGGALCDSYLFYNLRIRRVPQAI